MRKLLIWIVIASALVLLFAGTPALSAAAEPVTPYDYAVGFATAYPSRALAGGETQAAEALGAFLGGLGYTVTQKECVYRTTSTTGTKLSYPYKHVIGFKDNGKGRTLLIGAYYGDYEFSASASLGVGAETALSVGVLSSVASALASGTSAYDIAIAFWGGAATSLLDVKNCGVDVGKVDLYINLDAVGAGTYDYLYCDDLPRAHESYVAEIAKKVGAELAEPPVYKRSTALAVSDGAYAYTHLGLLGANRYFLDEDVPCVNFVGGAWTYDVGLYRYESKADIAGTSENTFEEIDARNGGREYTEKRLTAVRDVILEIAGDETLPTVIAAAKAEISGADLDSRLAYYLIIFIGAAAVIALFILLIVKQGPDRREAIWEEGNRSPENEGDPFSEIKGESPGERTDGDDDVFRF